MTRFTNTIISVAGAIGIVAATAAYVGAADKPADRQKPDVSTPADVKSPPAKAEPTKAEATKAEATKTDAAKAPSKVRVNAVMLATPAKGAKAKGLAQSLQERARSGDPYAQYFMGQKYHYGNGVKENRQTAFDWFKRAARGRVAAAHYVIGLIRLTGEIGAPDIVEAYARFRIAAKGGDVRAAAMIFYVGPRMNGTELRKSDVRYRALLLIGATKVDAKAGADKK